MHEIAVRGGGGGVVYEPQVIFGMHCLRSANVVYGQRIALAYGVTVQIIALNVQMIYARIGANAIKAH